MKTNVYVGGSYTGRARIKKEAERLASLGFNILSRWYDDEDFIEKAWDHNMHGRVAEAMAMCDTYAILDAQLVVIDTFEPSTTGGRYVELGAALMKKLLGHDITVVHIGPQTNIFETLTREHYDTWDDYISRLLCKGEYPLCSSLNSLLPSTRFGAVSVPITQS
jgi:hypothetical protein